MASDQDTALEVALERALARPWQAVPLPRPIPIAAIPTPALLLDAAVFEANLSRMAEFLAGRNKGFRPHAKTHKCPLIAARQLAAGAVGICVAKVSEAAVMVHAGIDRVLVTSPVADAARARLLARLAPRAANLDVAVDSPGGLDLLAAQARSDAPLGVLVDVDVAMGRTGTRDLNRVLALAEAAHGAPGLTFRGIQHYAGHVMHVAGHAERREKSLGLWESVTGIVDALTARGLPPEVVTGGGTGTYDIDCDVAAVTDLQVGSYAFMDQEYRLIGGRNGEVFDDFGAALQVAATVISQPTSRTVTVDGGYKAFASDSVNPVTLEGDGLEYRFAGDEHGVLVLKDQPAPPLGSVRRFITPHCDPTVNLYDYYWICRDGVATELWPVAARGCSW